ncbi:transporter substrate-binding domain-containing protein [Aeromonas veronii]|uniref:transporter substrate-binding domain-containing protein n=1 Tax=Aeromonas veronii TaxID=654 RepID=UPI0015E6B590|nr:transporter substrate-binding domain-containing protein [Aeromonas veronii]
MMKMTLSGNIIIILTLLVGMLKSANANNITLVSSEDTYNSMYGCWLHRIYSEAFSRLGYKLSYLAVPGGRAPLMAERGEVDGEIHRPFEYQSQTTNLIRVNEPHFLVTYETYVTKKTLKFHHWNELGLYGLRVEFRRGAKRAEKELTKVVPSSLLSDITSTEQGLKKLIRGRTDVFVEQTLVFKGVYETLQKDNKEFGFVYSAGIVDTLQNYVYLNKRHKTLGEKLALIIKDMKSDGSISTYMSEDCTMKK